MSKTKIEWADKSWNPVTGCTKISPGCRNCYAERMAKRLAGRCGYRADNPFKVTLHPERLDEPFHWKKPSRIFVCSMGDLFHEDVPFRFINKIWNIVACRPQHIFMILTKRPERTKLFTQWMAGADHISAAEWPRNCWLGVTAENQEQADKRIPTLLQIPASVRFVSVEPMLGPVDLTDIRFDKWTMTNVLEGCGVATGPGPVGQSIPNFLCEKINWVICGGESGPGARPMHPDWVRGLVSQCKMSNVPIMVKQMGTAWAKQNAAHNKKGSDPSEWPEDLQIREYPRDHNCF